MAALDTDDDGRLTGINDRAQLARAEWDMRVDLNDRWMRAGVTMLDPSTVYLDHAVELAQDVVLEPNVVLRGRTVIGERTRIATGSQVFDSRIGADCVIWASVIERSEVEDEVTIGPFSHLRPGTHVGRRSEIGNFAELKNSTLGEHVRQHHNSYMGDADVGADTNVGAGTITANYDGVRQAPHDDRGGRVPGRRHDAPRPGHAGRRVADRRRRRGHPGRAAGQARGRRAGADPRAASAA